MKLASIFHGDEQILLTVLCTLDKTCSPRQRLWRGLGQPSSTSWAKSKWGPITLSLHWAEAWEWSSHRRVKDIEVPSVYFIIPNWTPEEFPELGFLCTSSYNDLKFQVPLIVTFQRMGKSKPKYWAPSREERDPIFECCHDLWRTSCWICPPFSGLSVVN